MRAPTQLFPGFSGCCSRTSHLMTALPSCSHFVTKCQSAAQAGLMSLLPAPLPRWWQRSPGQYKASAIHSSISPVLLLKCPRPLLSFGLGTGAALWLLPVIEPTLCPKVQGTRDFLTSGHGFVPTPSPLSWSVWISQMYRSIYTGIETLFHDLIIRNSYCQAPTRKIKSTT